MEPLIDLLVKHKEWVFSGIGVSAIGVIITILKRIFRATRQTSPENQSTSSPISPQASPLPAAAALPAPPAPENKHVTIYSVNEPLDPNLTTDELAILRRFCSLPRGLHTQGYRDDYLFKELLSDIPMATLHLLLESLFLKGYIAIHKTENNWYKYYRLSEDGVRYSVNNSLVKLNDA